jgi:hypothetical protein
VLDWLIVGGGVHGTHLSLALLAAGVPEDRLQVVDPHDEPLEVFFRHVEATSMQYLRSPAVHHLALDPYGLKRFARGAVSPASSTRTIAPASSSSASTSRAS